MFSRPGIVGIVFILISNLVQSQNLIPVASASSVKFSIKNFGFNTTGSLDGIQGFIQFDLADPTRSVFEASVSSATISTGNNTRDQHLRGKDYFDVGQFPRISIKSESVSKGKSAGSYILHGELSIKNTRLKIDLPFTLRKSGSGYIFAGNFTINRLDYKIGSTSISLGNTVEVFLQITAK